MEQWLREQEQVTMKVESRLHRIQAGNGISRAGTVLYIEQFQGFSHFQYR